MKTNLKRISSIASAAMILIALVAAPIQAFAATSSANGNKTVYIAPNYGMKYHSRKNCRSLKKAISITTTTLSKVKGRYTACKICKPVK